MWNKCFTFSPWVTSVKSCILEFHGSTPGAKPQSMSWPGPQFRGRSRYVCRVQGVADPVTGKACHQGRTPVNTRLSVGLGWHYAGVDRYASPQWKLLEPSGQVDLRSQSLVHCVFSLVPFETRAEEPAIFPRPLGYASFSMVRLGIKVLLPAPNHNHRTSRKTRFDTPVILSEKENFISGCCSLQLWDAFSEEFQNWTRTHKAFRRLEGATLSNAICDFFVVKWKARVTIVSFYCETSSVIVKLPRFALVLAFNAGHSPRFSAFILAVLRVKISLPSVDCKHLLARQRKFNAILCDLWNHSHLFHASKYSLTRENETRWHLAQLSVIHDRLRRNARTRARSLHRFGALEQMCLKLGFRSWTLWNSATTMGTTAREARLVVSRLSNARVRLSTRRSHCDWQSSVTVNRNSTRQAPFLRRVRTNPSASAGSSRYSNWPDQQRAINQWLLCFCRKAVACKRKYQMTLETSFLDVCCR